MARTADLKTIVATLVAMLPGFIFPFLLTFNLSPRDSDELLLAMSIMTALIAVIGSAIELNTVSEFGRHLAAAVRPGPIAMNSYSRRVQVFGFAAVFVLGSTLTVVYSFSTTEWTLDFLLLCIAMLASPIIAIYSSLNSGMLIAAGDAVVPIASQALRPALAIALLFTCPTAPLPFFAMAFALGEAARWVILRTIRNRKLASRLQAECDPLETQGMAWQATSAAVSQGGPAIDRMFLSTAHNGSVSAYELANRLLFAALQLLNYGFLLRRVGRWSRLPKLTQSQIRSTLKKDFTVLIGAATALTLFGVAALYAFTMIPLPEIWHTSARWGIVLMLALPLQLWVTAASRVIIIARCQRLLLWFSLLTLFATFTFDLVFFTILGPFGIVLAFVCARALSSLAYAVAVIAVLPRISE